MVGGFGKLGIKDRQFVHVVGGRHLPQQVGGAQREAHDALQRLLKRHGVQSDVDAGAADHVLHGQDFINRAVLAQHQFTGEFDAAIHVGQGVFGAGAVGIPMFFEIARVVRQHGQQPQFQHPLRQARLHLLAMPAAQQAHHANKALQGVFQIVVMRVNGLIIQVLPGEPG